MVQVIALVERCWKVLISCYIPLLEFWRQF